MDLNIIWFLLVGVLVIGYAILDGFDLGVGIIHLFTKSEEEKRVNLNAIGPVWDGNEVWLLTGGGALFAAFPIVYATAFSAFYLAFVLLLAALIFRAVSFEFRKYSPVSEKKYWDLAFGVGSLVPALLYGVAIGNVLRGLPLDKSGLFLGNFFGLLNPYAILVGLVTLSMFTMHGAIYLSMKCTGVQRDRMLGIANKTWIAFVILYGLATVATFFVSSFLFSTILKNPVFWVLLVVLFASIVYLPIGLKAGKSGMSFIASSVMIAVMTLLMALSLFPRLLPSNINLEYSLTIYNSCSTPRTLYTMLVIALIGMPLVVGYTIFVYRVFKGKVVMDSESY